MVSREDKSDRGVIRVPTCFFILQSPNQGTSPWRTEQFFAPPAGRLPNLQGDLIGRMFFLSLSFSATKDGPVV